MPISNWLGLQASHLVEVDNTHRLHKEVAAPFAAMQAAARKEGIDLQIVSSYRDFTKQLAIWNRKWNGLLPVLSENNQPLNCNELTDTEKLHAILRWSALPGASRHHWGTDLDVYDKKAVMQWEGQFQLIDSEYQGLGPCAKLSIWLEQSAEQFGFYRPYSVYTGGIGAEPWHISHRKTAEIINKEFTPEALKSLLLETAPEGITCILDHFDEIYDRYILNKGTYQR